MSITPTIPIKPPSIELVLATIVEARKVYPPAEFRKLLRQALITRPDITLQRVAQALGITRQRVHLMVDTLGRPSCSKPGPRPAPKRDKAQSLLSTLNQRVANGEPAGVAAQELGISLSQAISLGFRARAARPPHGTQARAQSPCHCWRCRKAAHISLPRGPRSGIARRAAVEDWLAWHDPDTGEGLRQTEIGRLAGVSQGMVSRIANASK